MLGFAFGLWTGLPQRRGSGGGGGGWAQPTRPLPGGARQRACSRARALALERRRRPRAPRAAPWPGEAVAQGRSGGPVGGAGRPGRPYGGRRRLAAGGGGPAGPPPRPAKQNSVARGQRPRATLFQGASRPAAPPAGFFTNAKKATQKPGPTIYGPGYIIHLQEGTRHRPRPSGKARAHGLWARAA